MFLSKTKLSFNPEYAPEKPGVYFFFNSENEIIYIGSSFNLRERLKFHVSRFHSMVNNIDMIHDCPLIVKRLDQVENMSYMEFDDDSDGASRSEERKLILKHKPKYCGEGLKQREKQKYYKEVQLIGKEIAEYVEYHKKATAAFDKIMASRKEDIVPVRRK